MTGWALTEFAVRRLHRDEWPCRSIHAFVI